MAFDAVSVIGCTALRTRALLAGDSGRGAAVGAVAFAATTAADAVGRDGSDDDSQAAVRAAAASTHDATVCLMAVSRISHSVFRTRSHVPRTVILLRAAR